MLVTATVNGSKPLTFIVDPRPPASAWTGTSPLPRSASNRSAGRRTPQRRRGRGRRPRGMSDRVGPREFTPDQIRGLDFSDFADAFDVPVHGILGKPFFMNYAVEIDYPRTTMRLWDPGTYEPFGMLLPLRVGAAPTVRGTIRMPGGAPIPARAGSRYRQRRAADPGRAVRRKTPRARSIPGTGARTRQRSRGQGRIPGRIGGHPGCRRVSTRESEDPLCPGRCRSIHPGLPRRTISAANSSGCSGSFSISRTRGCCSSRRSNSGCRDLRVDTIG